MLGVSSLHLKHHVVPFIFIIFFISNKRSEFYKKKKMLHHEKPETLQSIIRNVWCLCENNILYKYQVILIVLDKFLFSNKTLKDIKKFW